MFSLCTSKIYGEIRKKYDKQNQKKTIMPYVGNKVPEQPVYICSLIKAIIAYLLIPWLLNINRQTEAGLGLCC